MILTIIVCLLLQVALCYSPEKALQMAYLAKIVKTSSLPQINSWTCFDCSKYEVKNPKAYQNKEANVKGFTGYSFQLRSILVVFSYQIDDEQWLKKNDTQMIQYPYCADCKVNKRFYEAYTLVKETVKSQIKQLRALYPKAPLTFTGHGVGGALAILSAADCYINIGYANDTYTEGQPRVGNSFFEKFVDSQIDYHFRIVHYADIISQFPPESLLYQHIGTQIWYAQDMQSYKICSGQDINCSASIPPSKYNLTDHMIQYYLSIKPKAQDIQRDN